MRLTLSGPEKFVVAGLLIFGGVGALATPLSAGYDEETHFIRAWEMAHLYLVPNEQLGARLPFPAIFWELSYRRQPLVEPVEPGFWRAYGALALDARDYIYANVETRSVYSPALLLPQAMTIRYLGLSLQLPALVVYYATRLAGLLSYILLAWLAVRFVPFGKWLLAVLAVSPMAVFQASTISADTISNGIAFLFIGGSLALAQRDEFGWREWLLQLGLLALLFLGKVNLIFLAFLPFLLMPPSRVRVRNGLWLLGAATLALFAIEVVGWNVVAYSHFTRALEGANPGEQLVFILADPLQFVRIIFGDVWTNTGAYLLGWIGVYGYNYWPVPGLTYIVYPLAVLASLAVTNGKTIPDKRMRWILGGLFVGGFLLTIVSLYVAFTPARSLFVAGVQGRYFTVVMPLLFLAFLGAGWSGSRMRADRPDAFPLTKAAALSAGLAMSALTLYSVGMLLSYRVPCGSEYYRWALCYQPQYKNWAPDSASSPPVNASTSLTQEIVPACDAMSELRLWVNSRGLDPDSDVGLTLRAPTQEKDVVSASFRSVELPENGWLTLRFPAEWHSDDQLYLLHINGTGSHGPRFGYSQRPEYMSGRLFENEVAQGQDILFQYGCIAGLQRLAGVVR